MRVFDHALLVGGGAAALLAGVAAAELGLAPIHRALTETAPSLDTTAAADAPEPFQAALHSTSAAYPPRVLAPVSVATPSQPPRDVSERRALRARDASVTQADEERAPEPELDAAPQQLARVDTDVDQDRDPPVSIVTSPTEDIAPPLAD